MSSRSCLLRLFAVTMIAILPATHAADPLSESTDGPTEVSLSPKQWLKIDTSVDRALEFLITQQGRDGSFNNIDTGQPGVTSLCVMAFLSRGHLPGEGPYGESLNRAIDFVLSKQRDNGLLFDLQIGRWRDSNPAHTGIYNHAIAGLMLTEVYGMGDSGRQKQIRMCVTKAVEFTLGHQSRFNRNRQEQGGWRYLKLGSGFRSDADLSITSWQLQFLRSARNAEFEVPEQAINNARGFVERCFDPGRGTFLYCIVSGRYATPAMAGAGIVSLSMGDRHDSESARRRIHGAQAI